MNGFVKSIHIFFKGTDKLLLSMCLLASAFGVLMVHSATINNVANGNHFSRDTFIMIVAITVGVLLCFLISVIDYEIILRLWPVIAIFCVLLMFSLFIFGVSPENRSDAQSWLVIGDINFQPSELLKIGFVITFALHLDTVKDKINNFKNIVLIGIHGLFPIALVIATGDLGSALVFGGIFVGMLFISGVYLRYFAGGLALCLAAAPIIWFKVLSTIRFSIHKNRILAVYFPDKIEPEGTYNTVIYQQRQSVNAIGSGRIWGKGLFSGSYTQNNLIPVDKSDMIFAVVGEELGFMGCVGLLLLLSLIILRIVFVGRKSKDNVSSIICYGIAFMIGTQSIINIGMCLKLLPCIGLTLPFISSGGSSNLCVYIGIGIVMSIYRANREIKPVNFRLSHIRTPFSEA